MSFMSVEEGERKKIGAAAALIDTFQAFQEAPKNKVSFKGNLCASCKSLLLLLGSFKFREFSRESFNYTISITQWKNSGWKLFLWTLKGRTQKFIGWKFQKMSHYRIRGIWIFRTFCRWEKVRENSKSPNYVQESLVLCAPRTVRFRLVRRSKYWPPLGLCAS